jgi:hypothetical protein
LHLLCAAFDPTAAFQRCFVAWVAAVVGAPAEGIAIDDKTLRRSAPWNSGLGGGCAPSPGNSGSVVGRGLHN